MIHVLYVDDENGSLVLGKEYLEMSGELAVDTAISVEEAQRAMARSHYDLIISDFQMPGIDGLQFLKMVREKDKNMPFILFTGRSRKEVVIDACNSGVSFYLQRGGDIEAQFVELEHKVKQAVAKRSAELKLFIKMQQSQMAMDMVRIAGWEYDEKTKMFEFDDIFYSLYGTDASQEGGHSISPEDYVRRFIHPKDVDRVAEWIEKGEDAMGPEGFSQIEHRIIKKDGEVRWFMVRVRMIKDIDGRRVQTCGVNQDITGLRTIENGPQQDRPSGQCGSPLPK